MTVNSAVRTLIRDQKTHQLDTIMQSTPGMQTMDSCITRLYNEGRITAQTAIDHAYNPEIMAKRIM